MDLPPKTDMLDFMQLQGVSQTPPTFSIALLGFPAWLYSTKPLGETGSSITNSNKTYS